MALPQWSWKNLDFYPISSDRTPPRWERSSRMEVHNHLGTGRGEFHTFGHGEYRLSTSAYVATLNTGELFEQNQNTSGTFSNGTESWNDVILVQAKARDRNGLITVDLEFARFSTT